VKLKSQGYNLERLAFARLYRIFYVLDLSSIEKIPKGDSHMIQCQFKRLVRSAIHLKPKMPSFTTVLASIAVFCHFADAKLQTRIPTVPIAKPYHETPVNRGAHHLARAYARYGVPVSDALKRSASQTGAVTSTNGGNDTYWVNPVNIDGQVLNLSKLSRSPSRGVSC
jgi:hypothetical protein